jgi:hypothetical protein
MDYSYLLCFVVCHQKTLTLNEVIRHPVNSLYYEIFSNDIIDCQRRFLKFYCSKHKTFWNMPNCKMSFCLNYQ